MEETLAYYMKIIGHSGYMILLYLLQYFIPAFPPHYSVYEEMSRYYRRMEVSLSRLGSGEPLTRRKPSWDTVKPLHSLPAAGIGVARIRLAGFERQPPLTPYLASLEKIRGETGLQAAYYTPLARSRPLTLPEALYEAQRRGYLPRPGEGLSRARLRGDPVVYDAAYPVRLRGECFEPVDKCITEKWRYALDTVLGLVGADDPYYSLLISSNVKHFIRKAREKVFSRALRDYMGVDIARCFRLRAAIYNLLGSGQLRLDEYPYYLIILAAHMESPVLKEYKLFREAWPRAVARRLEYISTALEGRLHRLYRAFMPRPVSAFRHALYTLIAHGVLLGSYVGYTVRCEPHGVRVDVVIKGVDEEALKVLGSALSFAPITPVIYYSTRSREAWFTGMTGNPQKLKIILSVAERKGLLQDFAVRLVEERHEYMLPFEMYSPLSHEWVIDTREMLWEMHYAGMQAWCRRILRCYEASHHGNGAAQALCRLIEEAPRRLLGKGLRDLEVSRQGFI